MKMMDNDTGPVPRRYSDAGSVERLVGVRASRYASGRPGLRRAGESGAGGLPPRQSHLNFFDMGNHYGVMGPLPPHECLEERIP